MKLKKIMGKILRTVEVTPTRENREKARDYLNLKLSSETKRKLEDNFKESQKRRKEAAKRQKLDSKQADEILEYSIEEGDLSWEKASEKKNSMDFISRTLNNENLSEEEKNEQLRYMTRWIFTKDAFKDKYDQHEKEYDELKKEKGDELVETRKQYIYSRFEEYIKSQGQNVIEGRIKERVERQRNKLEENNEEEMLKLDELEDEANAYINEHEEKIKNFDDLSEDERRSIKAGFIKIFIDGGAEPDSIEGLSDMFDTITEDSSYVYFAQEELVATYDEMVAMKDMNLSDEEWDKRRREALIRYARGPFKAYLEEAGNIISSMSGYNYGGESVDVVAYSTAEQVAHNKGAHIRRVAGAKDPNLYYLEFPALNDNSYKPKISILPSKTGKLSDATFIVEDNYGNESSGDNIEHEEMRGQKKHYTYDELLRVISRLPFDYKLNTFRTKSEKPVTDEVNINNIIDDNTMMALMESLYHKRFDGPVLDEHIKTFDNLMFVLLKDPSNEEKANQTATIDDMSDLSVRVRQFKTYLGNSQNASYAKKILASEGSKAYNVLTLMERIELMKRGGE
ncbi:hypothetical protein GF340_01075 [Candidatus Peregrinibacteria bacterium]|nr:hypothetical protein [Candidatus Peregrinibacteria bacterium]